MHFTALALALLPLAQAWILTDSYVGNDFYKYFDFQNIPDPTGGRVNYVDRTTAVKDNLTYASWDTFIVRADYKKKLDPEGPGRDSVRIRSKKVWKYGVTVLDVRHMPQGCTTWPAAWTVIEDDWPKYGEIDLIEGVNDQSPNAITLHSTANCTIPKTGDFTGTVVYDDCDVAANYNAGCSIKSSGPNTYGPSFNQNGGGIYVLERTSKVIRGWFFPRHGNIPLSLLFPSPIVDTRVFGRPQASFPNTKCDLDDKFKAHNFIINLTLCGDWAGQEDVWKSSGCPGECIDTVNNNPASFKDAYWDIKSLRFYQ